MRRGIVLATVLGAALVSPAGAAADPLPFGRACAAQADGTRLCSSADLSQRVKTFDGVPLDVDVTLPPSGDGPFPTLVLLHGFPTTPAFPQDKTTFELPPQGANAETFHFNNSWYASQGYAVVTYSARGFGASCGTAESRTPDCAQGWTHLADQRFEVRDTQNLLGTLVDEGIANPRALGVAGISYGAGQTLQLAMLNDRTRLPDGSLVPWTSPAGTPLKLAAAFARWGWSDLVESLVPNGRFLDFRSQSENPDDPIGVPLQSYVTGLKAVGSGLVFTAPPGADPTADQQGITTRLLQGEPFGPDVQAIANELRANHSAYQLIGVPPPLIIENGWTDDLFPPREGLRLFNRLFNDVPEAKATLQLGDLGHGRAQIHPNQERFFNDQGSALFDTYLKGTGKAPPTGVEAFTQTCPNNSKAAGPFTGTTLAKLHPGAVRFGSPLRRRVTSSGGNAATGRGLDPLTNDNSACRTFAKEIAPGTAIYTARSRGFTLLGLPTVRARVIAKGTAGQLDSRLWDVAPNGRQRLISRGTYRLKAGQAGSVTFQLQGNAYRFPAHHLAELELLGRDAPYLRPSNGTFSVEVSKLTVELPTRERPSKALGIVKPQLGG